jgi:hypothetical protein
MGLREIVDGLFSVAELLEDAVAGSARGKLLGSEPKPLRWWALPGFASAGVKGEKAWSLRLGNVVIAFAAIKRPDGEEAGDRTIWTDNGLKVRLRGKVLEVTGSEALNGILLDGSIPVGRVGDRVDPTVVQAAWETSVGGILGTGSPATFGVIGAGSDKVKAG